MPKYNYNKKKIDHNMTFVISKTGFYELQIVGRLQPDHRGSVALFVNTVHGQNCILMHVVEAGFGFHLTNNSFFHKGSKLQLRGSMPGTWGVVANLYGDPKDGFSETFRGHNKEIRHV